MVNLRKAYETSDVEKFESILKDPKARIMSDNFIQKYVLHFDSFMNVNGLKKGKKGLLQILHSPALQLPLPSSSQDHHSLCISKFVIPGKALEGTFVS
jgi:hypothetical protein